MNKIYKYTLNKYRKAISSWLILLVSMAIAGFLGGYLPFSSFKYDGHDAAAKYTKLTIVVVAAITTFLALFTSVFSGFKAATMFKDEVEDGTFLIMLSKPIDRKRILLGKLLALQTAILFFTFMTSLAYATFTYIFDTGSKVEGLATYNIRTLKEQIWKIAAIIWGILALTGFIFSSIGVLLSTKVSVGATIGISIGLSVVIPATSIIGSVTKKDEYKDISKYSESKSLISQLRGYSHSLSNGESTKLNSLLDGLSAEIDDPKGIYSLGVATGETNGFKNFWPLDINFQIQKLSAFASDSVASDLGKKISMTQVKHEAPGYTDMSLTIQKDNPLYNGQGHEEFNYIINYLKEHVSTIYSTMEIVLKSSWKTIKDKAHALFNNATSTINPTLAKTALSSQKIDLGAYFSRTIRDIFSPKWENGITINNSFLQEVWTHDHENGKAAKKDRTSLGYRVWKDSAHTIESQMPTDLSKEWWVDWYKLSKEMYEDSKRMQDAGQADASFSGVASAPTVFNAIDSLFSTNKGLYAAETPNYNGRTLSEIIGYDNHNISAPIRVLTISWLKTRLASTIKNKNIPGIDANSIEQMVHKAVSLIERATAPISSLIVDRAKANKETKELNIPDLPSQYTFQYISKKISSPEKGQDHEFAIDYQYDANSINTLLSIAYHHPEMLSSITNTEQVSKTTILFVYLGIALFLLPLTYILIRRMDFK